MTWRELMITIPVTSHGLVLEGVWQAGTNGGAVIAPAHPLMGGTADHPVLNEIAYAVYREGLASVRFNWRGVGASQGVPSGEWPDAESDYDAATEHLAESVDGPLVAAGYSFGAVAAARVALRDVRLRELLLVAPPADPLRELPLKDFQGPIHVIVGGRDKYAPIDLLSEQLSSIPNARLDVIPAADHFFFDAGLAELQQLIRSAVS